jgi:hypothetical protein
VKTTVSTKGQIVLPADFAKGMASSRGRRSRSSGLTVANNRLTERKARPNEGVVDWLLACPEKGFFVPLESESTDTL